ncbi:phosphoenolpyruvate-protein phosphotransferase [Oxobacter pfennigii]|uniref:Phosphoenolpyruvate-protein phosphotransferase n=1 Tax=Oxobacter pfennigii TaxID=36849 RepID=A0A0P9AL42_9CLOT|nr:PEP-utilizing enzyme [Oxobacter pfennigii]KPU46058.1 phosphoenolpyruvate-protein phosphotransferase [Oxobacter pfennigii]
MLIASGVSLGVGVSKAKVFIKNQMKFNIYNTVNVSLELDKVDYCIKETSAELNSIYLALGEAKSDSVHKVLTKYISAINSPHLVNDIKERIAAEGISAECAITSMMEDINKIVKGLDDEYLSERSEDIEEIKCRLLNKITGYNFIDFSEITEECIVVSEDLTPGDVLNMNPTFVKGIVTINGGPTSSTSVMARRMNIPAVTGTGREGRSIKNGDILIVDGNRGRVIINPDERELTSYGIRIYDNL